MKRALLFFAGLVIIFTAACTPMLTPSPQIRAPKSVPPIESIQISSPPPTATQLPQIPTQPDNTASPLPTQTNIPPTSSPTPLPNLSWDQAVNHLGETRTVCGPVIGAVYVSTSEGRPTFLNLGVNFPDATRFSVIIWGDFRDTFLEPPETAYLEETICVTGEILQFEGVAQMAIETPDQISIR